MPVSSNSQQEMEKTANQPAMTEQQRQYSSADKGKLAQYRELTVGDKGLGFLGCFELYNLLFGNLPGLLGLGIRSLLLPKFLALKAKGLVVGKSVSIRGPKGISFGRGVFVDDFVSFDARGKDEAGTSSVIEVGDHVFVGKHSIISAKPGRIKLGNAVNISSYCRLATQTNIEIGESVLIASYVYIGPGNHNFDDSNTPIMEQGMTLRGGVSIGDDVWIGTRATILDGVKIGKGAVVGAHSLVTEDVPDNAIVAGVPAKVIRLRD